MEAEQALLGAILVNNDAYYRVSDFLKPEHLYEPLHRKIFEVASEIIRMGKTANPVTIKTFLPADQKVGDLTVAQYLARLASEAVTIINAEDYGRAIYDLALRRSLIQIGEDVVNIAYDAPLDMPPQASRSKTPKRRLFALAENGRYDGGFQSFSDAVAQAVDMAGAAFERDGNLSGVSTGIMSLDRQDGRIAALRLDRARGTPGHGQDVACHQYRLEHCRRLRARGLARRLLQGRRMAALSASTRSKCQFRTAGHSYHVRADGSLLVRRSAVVTFTTARVREAGRLFPDHAEGAALSSTRPVVFRLRSFPARARRLKRQRGLDFLVVDYIQLMTGTGKASSENRVQEMTEITTGLKALGKELNVPIIALSQLSRQVESRDDKRPQLSDLRESGSIEQDADVVLFVFREEYYVKNMEPRDLADPKYPEWEAHMDKVKGTADVIIAKQRHGPTGTVKLAFQSEFTRFADLAEPSFIQYEEP